MNKEVVIAAYDKELNWISQFNDDVKVTAYRKGDILPLLDGEIKIKPNKGRCVHTFFKHIHDQYNNLSDITFFAQDYPFDHWEDIIDVVNKEIWNERCALQIGGYYGFHFNTITQTGPNGGCMWALSPSIHHGGGKVLTCQPNGLPQWRDPNVNLCDSWVKFFAEPSLQFYEFIPGGHFAITKEKAHLRTRDFYRSIVDFLEKDPVSAGFGRAGFIERLECYIFNSNFKTRL